VKTAGTTGMRRYQWTKLTHLSPRFAPLSYFVGKDAVVNITLTIDMQPNLHIGVRTFVLIFD
jgi:hypothetical protein